MSASATCILHWNAIPVFADIDEETFVLMQKPYKRKLQKELKPFL